MGWAPAVIEAAVSIWGAIQASKAQGQDAAAATSLNEKEGGLIGSLAGAPWLQPVLNAERSGVATLKSQVGGVPNIGDLAKTLLGEGLTGAISAALGQRSSNLQSAIGDISEMSGRASSAAQGIGNPFANVAAGVSGLPWGQWFGGGNSTTGTPGSDVLPASPGGTGANPGNGGLWSGGPVSSGANSY